MTLIELQQYTISEERSEESLQAQEILEGFDQCSYCAGTRIGHIRLGKFKCYGCRKESYRLDAVALEEVGEQKVRYTETIPGIWKNSPALLVEYNFKDVELCVKINKKPICCQDRWKIACRCFYTLCRSPRIGIDNPAPFLFL